MLNRISIFHKTNHNVMDIQTKKLQLIEQLTRVEDDTILEQIREVLSAQVPLGFDELGNPINQSALKQRVLEFPR